MLYVILYKHITSEGITLAFTITLFYIIYFNIYNYLYGYFFLTISYLNNKSSFANYIIYIIYTYTMLHNMQNALFGLIRVL